MPKRSHKSKGGWWLIVIVLLSILFITYQGKLSRYLEVARQPVATVFGTFHKLIQKSARQMTSVWENYVWLMEVYQENIRLRQDLHQTRETLNLYREYKLENDRLRALLNFKRKAAISVTPAMVIANDPSNVFRTIMIDKGTKDGVKTDKAVVTHEGVVGRVIEAYPGMAKVLLVCDSNSSLAVMIQRTRDEAVMTGWKTDACRINYLPRTAEVQKGDVLITSGLGGIFPKGLVVGQVTVTRKDGHGLFQYAEAVPSVNFSKLEEVLVVN